MDFRHPSRSEQHRTRREDRRSKFYEISDTVYKLERTRSRGVYRSGRLYVVPFIDGLGRERRREFETATQAHDFRTGLRIAEEAQTVYTGPAYRHGDRSCM
jgi:hypothetical protein